LVVDLLLLALRAVIWPAPGGERVCRHAERAGGLGHRLVCCDRQCAGALLQCSRIVSRRGVAHRTHLVGCVSAVSPCVRQSIATSPDASVVFTLWLSMMAAAGSA